jgi:hypothetical protein
MLRGFERLSESELTQRINLKRRTLNAIILVSG